MVVRAVARSPLLAEHLFGTRGAEQQGDQGRDREAEEETRQQHPAGAERRQRTGEHDGVDHGRGEQKRDADPQRQALGQQPADHDDDPALAHRQHDAERGSGQRGQHWVAGISRASASGRTNTSTNPEANVPASRNGAASMKIPRKIVVKVCSRSGTEIGAAKAASIEACRVPTTHARSTANNTSTALRPATPGTVAGRAGLTSAPCVISETAAAMTSGVIIAWRSAPVARHAAALDRDRSRQ